MPHPHRIHLCLNCQGLQSLGNHLSAQCIPCSNVHLIPQALHKLCDVPGRALVTFITYPDQRTWMNIWVTYYKFAIIFLTESTPGCFLHIIKSGWCFAITQLQLLYESVMHVCQIYPASPRIGTEFLSPTYYYHSNFLTATVDFTTFLLAWELHFVVQLSCFFWRAITSCWLLFYSLKMILTRNFRMNAHQGDCTIRVVWSHNFNM